MNTAAVEPAPEGLQLVPPLIKRRWQVLQKIGQGTFGHTYQALDLQLNKVVALKIEDPQAKKPVLKLEVFVLRQLQDSPHVCRFIGCGKASVVPNTLESFPNDLSKDANNNNNDNKEGDTPRQPPPFPMDRPVEVSFMVMQLLGENLSDLRRKQPQHRFSIATTSLLGREMLRGIRAMHEHGFLHRDIKPSNFVMEADDFVAAKTRPRCYIIDFGLARRFCNNEGKLRSARDVAGFRGTARYASLAAHENKDLGRQDDLWSLFYVLVECLSGSLPWRKEKDKKIIGEMKRTYTNHTLVQDLPLPMTAFLQYLQSLHFTSIPDYDRLERILEDLFRYSDAMEDVLYDWQLRALAEAKSSPKKAKLSGKASAGVISKSNVSAAAAAVAGGAVAMDVDGAQQPQPPSKKRLFPLFRLGRFRKPSTAAEASVAAASTKM